MVLLPRANVVYGSVEMHSFNRPLLSQNPSRGHAVFLFPERNVLSTAIKEIPKKRFNRGAKGKQPAFYSKAFRICYW